MKTWVDEYAPIHAVAHWDDRQRKSVPDYDRAFGKPAKEAERLLGFAGREPAEVSRSFPVIVWEDQDECLEVRPEDVAL